MDSIAGQVSHDRASQWLCEALDLPEGGSPFPWQEELFARFARGAMERSLDIPTGLGKTAVMALWLVARACGGKLPRRLVYVVDRRAVVDQATEVAVGLRECVERLPELKRALGLAGRPLPISTLRGQHVDNREWLEDPASLAIIVGTVDMIGSRLLFEGYGCSRKMRPYHAGLLGADSLVVLDEAHLVPPFEKLLETVADGAAQFGAHTEAPQDIVPKLTLLSLSATGRPSQTKAFGLTEKDEGSEKVEGHPVVRRRLDAPKHLKLYPLEDPGGLAEVLAERAWRMVESGKRALRCIIFCNNRKDASDTLAAIKKRAKGDRKEGSDEVKVDIELFVGGRRVFERTGAARRLKQLGFIAGTKVEPPRPAFVVATSAGEVGVDLDADHMVSDLVAWERMVQRLGRVNRRGDGKAEVIVVVEPAPMAALSKPEGDRTPKEKNAVVAYERARTWKEPLDKLIECDADASPGALRKLKLRAAADPDLQRILDAATTPAPLRPALTRALADAWSMTSLTEHTGRPDIDPWLRGWIPNDRPKTSVVWRTYLPARSREPTATRREMEAFLDAAPPHASEVLERETDHVLDWLAKRATALLTHASAKDAQDGEIALLCRQDVVAIVLSPAGDVRASYVLGSLQPVDDDKDREKQRKEELKRRLAGATLVVDARIGGLELGLLEAAAMDVPRTIDDGGSWPDDDTVTPSAGPPAIRFRVRAVDAGAPVALPTHWMRRHRFAADLSDEGEPMRWLEVLKWRHDAATEEDRSAGRPQKLDEHQEWTEKQALALADRIGLRDPYAKMLAVAARLHDEGKRSGRWQRAFNANRDDVYAKTRGPVNIALLDGYRHEFGSLPTAERNPRLRELPADLQDLALHMIAAHHGFARPVIGTGGCEDAPPSALEARAGEVALRFARLQKRWGPWGLAWWEALLRAADQQASRENDEQEDA